MKLLITEEERSSTDNTYCLTFAQIEDHAYHPFIATQDWECVEVEITEKTPTMVIAQLANQCTIKPILYVETLDKPFVLKGLQVVASDHTAELRKLFQSNLEQYLCYVQSLADTHDWSLKYGRVLQ